MSRIEKIIGKKMTHSQLGKVQVKSRKPNSRVIVIVEVIDRGKGWDEKTQTYKGHKNSVGWMRGENRHFGCTDEVHINSLK